MCLRIVVDIAITKTPTIAVLLFLQKNLTHKILHTKTIVIPFINVNIINLDEKQKQVFGSDLLHFRQYCPS